MTKLTAGERFWAKVDKSGDCWVWTAARNALGYGKFSVRHQRWVFAHRFAYEMFRGPIPAGLVIDHLCRNPPCVNPDHLEPVTNRENLLRGVGIAAKHAAKTHCDSGHEFTSENTYITPKGRVCRECHRLTERARRRRNGYEGPKTHCPQGHEYTPENTYVNKGARYCRTCGREATRRYKARIRLAAASITN